MATDKSVRVQVRGLAELRNGFKQVMDGEKGALKAEFLPIADNVAGSVQQRMPHKTGRAQSSVKAKATDYGATVAAGGGKATYYPWLDFGGSVGRGHVDGSAWSGSIKRPWMGKPGGTGRYLYPAIEEQREATVDAAGQAIINVAKRAGFETR